jgi:hypothetical protein
VSNDENTAPPSAAAEHEHEIRALVARLGRPNASGGTVIERAALLAEGADFAAVMAWILAHGGQPERTRRAAPRRGLYGSASDGPGAAGTDTPRRFVLPAGALTRSASGDAHDDEHAHLVNATPQTSVPYKTCDA